MIVEEIPDRQQLGYEYDFRTGLENLSVNNLN